MTLRRSIELRHARRRQADRLVDIGLLDLAEQLVHWDTFILKPSELPLDKPEEPRGRNG